MLSPPKKKQEETGDKRQETIKVPTPQLYYILGLYPIFNASFPHIHLQQWHEIRDRAALFEWISGFVGLWLTAQRLTFPPSKSIKFHIKVVLEELLKYLHQRPARN